MSHPLSRFSFLTLPIGVSVPVGRAHEFETILNVAQALSYTYICRRYHSYAKDITFLFIGSRAKRAWIMPYGESDFVSGVTLSYSEEWKT